MPANINLKPSKIQGKVPNAKVQESFQCKDFNRFFMRAFKGSQPKYKVQRKQKWKSKTPKMIQNGKLKKK